MKINQCEGSLNYKMILTTIETESKLLEQSSPKFIKSYLNLYLLNVLKATFAQNFFWNKFDVNVNDVEELLNFSLSILIFNIFK